MVIRDEYKGYFDAMCHLDTTEKQAMAMSCLLVADRILVEQIFKDEQPFDIEDVKEYLRSAAEVDVAERAYQMVLNWIARNPVRFEDPKAAESLNKGEVWGKILQNEDQPGQSPVAVINKDVLCDYLEQAGFDYAAVSKKWAKKNRLERNSQEKYIHNTKVYGIKANYIKLIMEPNQDPDGFVSVDDMEDGEQMSLPFD